MAVLTQELLLHAERCMRHEDVTPDKESSMSTLWQEEEFKQICSRESLTEKAADIEKTISVKEHKRKRCQ